MRTPPPSPLERLGQGSGALYLQVKRALLARIESQMWPPGECLPSETVIAGDLGVSIGTLRRAVDELVHEQVLVRRQGKGTFVALHSRDRYLFQFFRVEPRADRFGGSAPGPREYPQVECLSFERQRADEAAADALRLRVGDPVYTIHNRLSLQRRPVVLDQIVISATLFKGLNEKRYLERSSTIYNFYQTEFGITVLHARERARAVVASREVMRRLGLPAGSPLIEVQRLACSFGQRPVEWRTSLIHTQQHDYVSDVSAPR
jgi:GntR family transcriptional regulator